jgi:hypothetical protein
MQAVDSREIPPEEAAHAKRLHDRIKYFDGLQSGRRASWKKARTYVDGNPNGDGEKGLVRVNLVGSYVETLQANIYAKAPEISALPEERPDETAYPALSGVAKAVQAALNTFLVKDANLKTRGKTAVRATLTCGTSWAKVIYSSDKSQDPIIQNSLNDIQDNIANLEKLRSETQDYAECANHDAKLVELHQQELALQSKLEVTIAQGLAVDIVPSEDVVVLDGSVKDIDQLDEASAIAHRIKITGSAFKAKFKFNPPAVAYIEEPSEIAESKNIDEDDKLFTIYEVWSKDDNTVYTICKGLNQYVRDPFQPDKLGDRWYPFFALQIRRVDGVLYPLSIVELLIELQDEYNTRRTRAAEHRRKNRVTRIINKASDITDEEIRQINGRSIDTEFVMVSGNPNIPLNQQIESLNPIPYDPMMYDPSDVMRDMEMVAGVQDASRGAINKAKTATEAEIMSQGMQSRSSETIDMVENWLSDIANYSAHLLILNMPIEKIQERLGQDVMWPQITGREQLAKIGITIRSGSTARPNKMRERDQWIQLMPMIQEALQKSSELEQAGNKPMAKAVMKVLQETLKRFDEKIDIQTFLGVNLDDKQQQQDLPPEIMRQIQQGKQLITDLQQKLDMATQALQSKVDDQQSAKDDARMQADTTISVAQEKARADYQAKIEAANISAQVERERIASNERISIAREYAQAGLTDMIPGALDNEGQAHEMSEDTSIEGQEDMTGQEMMPVARQRAAKITPNTVVHALSAQSEMHQATTQQLAQLIAHSSEQNAQVVTSAVAHLTTLMTQALTAPKSVTLSNGKKITVETEAPAHENAETPQFETNEGVNE